MRVMPYWPFSELTPLNDIDQYLSWVYRFEVSISKSLQKYEHILWMTWFNWQWLLIFLFLLCWYIRTGLWGFPGGSVVKNLPAKQRHEFNPWVGKIPWRRKRQPIPVLLPLESHGWRSLVGYTVHRVAQSQTRQKWLSTHARILIITQSQMFSNFPGDFFWPMNCLKVCSLIYKYLCPILIDF